MIQFNLLPDVKLQYIRATYRKRVIIMVSIAASAVFAVIFVLLFLFVKVNQPRHLSNLDKDIDSKVRTLKEKKDLDKILTIQNQLNSLPGLHGQKVFGSRLFDYLTQLTPADAEINNIEVDFEAKTISLKGDAKDIVTVNKFVDTLKFTDYKIAGESAKEGKAFSSVVLQSFNIGSGGQSSEASFDIMATFDEAIFSNTAEEGKAVANGVTLIVPKITTTRSQTQSAIGGGQ
jgi:Tfp pilus assembly protein PilN